MLLPTALKRAGAVDHSILTAAATEKEKSMERKEIIVGKDRVKKPNILWIMTDQQSYKMMSCAGNRDLNTPNMDYLAMQGTRFTNVYCTNPVCLPSRFSLLTGHYPGDIGLSSNDFRREVESLPKGYLRDGLGKLLKEAGYEAVYGGKEHLPHMCARDLGFDYICRDEREELAETCADYIRNYNSEKPFAMTVSFINPHDICLMAISDFAAQSGPMEQSLAKELKLETDTVHEAMKIPEGMHPDIFYSTICPKLPPNHEPAEDEPEAVRIMQEQRLFKKLARENYSEEQWRLQRYAYARLTEKVDAQIGRVLTALKESGKWEETVILFTSDHGDLDASHKMEHKTALYQESCKVPLIIKGLSGPANAEDGRLTVNGLDLICTVMDYAGIEKPEHLEGISLREAAELGIQKEEREYAVVESEFGIAAIGKRFKYVCYNCGKNAEQFYDLENNHGEDHNQINDPVYSQIAAKLKKGAEEHQSHKGRDLGV